MKTIIVDPDTDTERDLKLNQKKQTLSNMKENTPI